VAPTTPLSGMICHPLAGTSYDQLVYQVRSLQLHPLRRYEKWGKMWKFGWFGAVRGHL